MGLLGGKRLRDRRVKGEAKRNNLNDLWLQRTLQNKVIEKLFSKDIQDEVCFRHVGVPMSPIRVSTRNRPDNEISITSSWLPVF